MKIIEKKVTKKYLQISKEEIFKEVGYEVPERFKENHTLFDEKFIENLNVNVEATFGFLLIEIVEEKIEVDGVLSKDTTKTQCVIKREIKLPARTYTVGKPVRETFDGNFLVEVIVGE